MKRMKRILSLFLCLCTMMAAFPSGFAAYDESEIPDEYEFVGENTEEVEEPYLDSTTIFDLDDEVEYEYVPDLNEEEPPEEDPVPDDGDIYTDYSFNDEVERQLNAGEYVLDEIIIKFYPIEMFPGKEKQYNNEIAKLTKVGFVEGLDAYVVKEDDLDKNPNAILNRFKNNRFIEYVEPNYLGRVNTVTPNDPNFYLQSNAVNNIGAPAGWAILNGSSSVPIAIIDTGYAPHADLPAPINAYSATAGLSYNNDANGHGTKVAGVAGAIGNNGVGGTGINWNAAIMPVKVDTATGSLPTANIANGIIWAANNGAGVISISIAMGDSITLKNAIDYAYNKGCVIVAGSGNDGREGVVYPARYPNVLGVGAMLNQTSKASYSNTGQGLDICALGSYYTTFASGSYGSATGTSIATPQVAALASLVMALGVKSPEAVYDVIQRGATGNGSYNTEVGYGLINIGRTLELASGKSNNATEEEAAKKAAEAAAKAAEEAATKSQTSDFISFITSAIEGNRNDYTGMVGYEFEPRSDMTVSSIGRPVSGTMIQSHTITIWDVSTKSLLASGTVTPSSLTDSNGFKVANLDKTITLKAGQRYRIVSTELSGGDKWLCITESPNLIPTGDCRIIIPVYSDPGVMSDYPSNTYTIAGVKGYVGVTFYYEAITEQTPPQTTLPPETPQEVRTSPVIRLTGFTSLTLEYGQAYSEMGFTAADCKGVDISGAVKVTNNIDIWKAGIYTVTYEVADSGFTARATRTVTVNPKPADPPKPTAPKITIIGSNPIILHSTSATKYTEQMARAVDHDGTDISSRVTVTGTINRATPSTYTLTYSVTSPSSGLTSTTTRNVRIVGPTEKREPRTKYGLSGQAKQGGKVTHTGILSGAVGFMDLTVSSIDKNMTIFVELVDTSTKKVTVKDTFTAAGTKQYRIDQSKYELVVTVDKANGNSKYDVNLLMPETAATYFFADEEVPLASFSFAPKIAPVGSNPIILHLGSRTPYTEQGARALDYLGNDISNRVTISGVPNINEAGTYWVTYSVVDDDGEESITLREVRILGPDEIELGDEEVPLANFPNTGGGDIKIYYIAFIGSFLVLAGLFISRKKKKTLN